MKKLSIIGLVLVLIAFSAVPVFAKGPNNGHGNGVSAGQGNGVGNQKNQQDKNQDRNRDQVQGNRPTTLGNTNHTGNRMRTPFYLQGTVVDFNSTDKTITISLIHGNAQVKSFMSSGTDLIVHVTGTTMMKLVLGDETDETAVAPSTNSTDDGMPAAWVPFTFDKLAKGDLVAIHGNVVMVNSTSTFNATKITIFENVVTGQPETEQP